MTDICKEDISKQEIQEAIVTHHLKTLKEEMKHLHKCDELIKTDMRTPQAYFSSKSLVKARIGFRIQTRMLDIPGNMPGKYQDKMVCEACLPWIIKHNQEGVVASQSHYLFSGLTKIFWITSMISQITSWT